MLNEGKENENHGRESEMGFASSNFNYCRSSPPQLVGDEDEGDLKPLNNNNSSSNMDGASLDHVTSTLTQALVCSATASASDKLRLIRDGAQDYLSSSLYYFPPLFSLHTPTTATAPPPPPPLFPDYNHNYNLWAWEGGAEIGNVNCRRSYCGSSGDGGGDDSYLQSLIGGRGISVSAMKMKMKMKMKKMKARRKVREPRFCFKTMSDVDVLDDGYKWRKYGQKVVKNTLHPRSYYRCTQEKCRVKKRVERLAEDPRMVITTYEGRHVHSPSHELDDSQIPQPHLNNFFW